MRKAFLYPIFQSLKRGRFNWLTEQARKGIVLKYLNKILPKKIVVGPTMAILCVTYRCNSRCVMCDLVRRASPKKKEYTTNEWQEIIDQLAEIKTAGIGFTGGEPLLRPDIDQLLAYAKQKGLSTTLNTNGLLFSDKNIKKILEAQPDNINISLDGAQPAVYDKVRGVSGGFNQLIKNFKNLSQERNRLQSPTTITISTCVSRYNVNELEKIADLGTKLGADKIGFLPMHSITKTQVSCQTYPPQIGKVFLEKINRIRTKGQITIDNTQAYLQMLPIGFAGQKFPLRCSAGEASITIDCYGHVFACWSFLELNQPSFKLTKKRRLKDIWLSKEYQRVRQKTSSCRDCFWNCHAELSIFYQ